MTKLIDSGGKRASANDHQSESDSSTASDHHRGRALLLEKSKLLLEVLLVEAPHHLVGMLSELDTTRYTQQITTHSSTE